MASAYDSSRAWADSGGDMLSIYEREDEERRAMFCPVCTVRWDAPETARRTITVITGNDSWDTYPCPGCCAKQFQEKAQERRENRVWIDSTLRRAALDVAARRRLTPTEHREAQRA